MNRRKAILRTIRRILTLMLAVLAVPLVIQAYESPNLRVVDVVVEGTQLLDPSEVTAVLPVRDESMLWVSPGDLAAQVKQLPAVKAASVHFRFPGRLLVQVEERRPEGIVRTGSKSFFVDQTGLIISRARGDSLLVTMDYAGGEELRPGARLDPSSISAAVKLDDLLRNEGDMPGKRFEYAPGSGLAAVAQTGLRVVFGGEEDLAYKVEAFRAIMKAVKAQKRAIHLIDVRYGDRPYFR